MRNFFNSRRKKLALANHKEGKSYSEIAGIIQRSKSVVYRRFTADKSLEPKPRIGRPPMTTKWEDRMIVKMSLKTVSIKQRLFFVHFVSKRESQSLEKLFLAS